MTTYIVAGKERVPVDSAVIAQLRSGYKNCVLDVGAGDGKGSLRYARAHSETYVIALDSSYDALSQTSKVASKKPTRGGVENLACIYGNVRDSYELEHSADLVRVILPWGDLLEGIAEVSPDIVSSLSRCGTKNAQIAFVINAEIWKSNLPARLSHLGEITPEFFLSRRDDFMQCGIDITEAHVMSAQEIEELDTTWAAKLMSSRESAQFVMATGALMYSDSSPDHEQN